jgi:hypothetical protein
VKVSHIAPRFVEHVPEILEPGLLYVSLDHGAMVHLCACGCGHEVSLPLSPIDWKLSYDGEKISLRPSVGNWSFPCRSHYVIEGGRVNWADDWSEEAVAVGRRRDKRRRDARLGIPLSEDAPTDQPTEVEVLAPVPAQPHEPEYAPPRRRSGFAGFLAWIIGR